MVESKLVGFKVGDEVSMILGKVVAYKLGMNPSDKMKEVKEI